jgi:hypothetical protein
MGSRDTAGSRFERWAQRLGLLVVVPTLVVLFAAAIFAIGEELLAKADETVGDMRQAVGEGNDMIERMSKDPEGVK